MVNYREILRLQSLNYSQRQIAASAHCSRHTIRDVLVAAKEADIRWPLEDSVTNGMLEAIFYPERLAAINPRKEPNYGHIHKELARSGVNLTLLWSEYCEECRINGNTPYMYTQFCDKYRRWARATKATMRIHHKPGDAMQVDWAGNTIPIYEKVTGEVGNAYLFIAVLPCSCKAYAEACDNMRTEAWLLCHAHAYSYFCGVTRLLIPDNLKVGVQSNTRYETVLNRSYQEMAEHYGTAIVPARVRAPQDKSLAEGTVKYASTWIIAALRDRKFFSISEVREAVSKKLEELNNRAFKKREGSRNSAYRDEEQEFMKPLPFSPFEPAVWSTAEVHKDYLISDGKNKYSVPFDLIGETVDIRLTFGTVEAFFHGSRVSSFPRAQSTQRDPIVNPNHMPTEHRKYLLYNVDDFLAWGESIGSNTEAVVQRFLTSGREPEQGYKSCASLAKLADRYGHKRLENACSRILEYSNDPTIRNINTILKNGQDKAPVHREKIEPPQEYGGTGITRGAAYFSRKGGASE